MIQESSFIFIYTIGQPHLTPPTNIPERKRQRAIRSGGIRSNARTFKGQVQILADGRLVWNDGETWSKPFQDPHCAANLILERSIYHNSIREQLLIETSRLGQYGMTFLSRTLYGAAD